MDIQVYYQLNILLSRPEPEWHIIFNMELIHLDSEVSKYDLFIPSGVKGLIHIAENFLINILANYLTVFQYPDMSNFFLNNLFVHFVVC